jgi:hypothetical protein
MDLEKIIKVWKEVQITPTTIAFWTENPCKFKMGHLTPLTIKYHVIDPL